MEAKEETCKLWFESFKDATADGPYLTVGWTCRKCGLLPAEHPHRETSQTNTANANNTPSTQTKSPGMAAFEESKEQDMNVLVLGNPGSGKSTVLNCLLGQARFLSGMSTNALGITSVEQKEVVDADIDECPVGERNPIHGWSLIDTPGLADAKARKNASLAIKRGLQAHGLYKLIFCLTLEAGRVRPADIATIVTVLKALEGICFIYHIIINKATPREIVFYNNEEARRGLITRVFSYAGLPAPTSMFFIPNEVPLVDTDNGFLSTACALQLRRFVYNAEFCAIDKNLVQDLQPDCMEEYAETYERKTAEASAKNAEEIATMQRAAEAENATRQDFHNRLLELTRAQLTIAQDAQKAAEAAASASDSAAAAAQTKKSGFLEIFLNLASCLPVVGPFVRPVADLMRK